MAADPVLATPSRKYLKDRGRSAFADFLVLHSLGVALHDDHFMGASLRGGEATEGGGTLLCIYQSTASGTASAAAAIDSGVVNGQVKLDPGTDNAGRSDLSLGLHFQSQLNCVIAARVKHNSSVGSAKFEIGFTDVVSGTDAGAVNAKVTPTWNASDAAVLCYDTNDDTQFTLMGVAAGVVSGVTDTAFTPTADTFYTYVVACISTTMYAFILDAHGSIQYQSGGLSGGPTADTLLTPWLFCQNRSGARRSVNVDRLTVWQMETTS